MALTGGFAVCGEKSLRNPIEFPMVVLREPLMQPCAPYCSAGDDAVGKGSADQRLSRGSKWLILNLGAGAEPGGANWPDLIAPTPDTCRPSGG